MIRKKLIAAGILTSLLLVGCSQNEAQLKAGEQETNTLSVNKKGTVQVAVVESFDKPYYSDTELEDYLKTVVADYNEKAGADTVKMTSIAVKDKRASSVFEYKGIEDYVTLNEAEASWGTMEEAKHLLPDTLLNEEGEETSITEILQDSQASKYKVLLLNEEYDVIIEGVVKYYVNAVLMSKESVHTQPQQTSVILYK